MVTVTKAENHLGRSNSVRDGTGLQMIPPQGRSQFFENYSAFHLNKLGEFSSSTKTTRVYHSGMKTFLYVFNTLPAVLNAVVAVESAVPVSGAGAQKLNIVLGAAGAAWEASHQQQQLSKDATLNAINAITSLTVAGLNTAGVFRKSKPA